ncbi:MAG: LTA synthase family protein [Lautropia sp.]
MSFGTRIHTLLRPASRWALLLAFALFVSGSLSRLAFGLWFGPSAPAGQAGFLHAMVYGARFDARVALATMLPLWVAASLPWLGRRIAPVRSRSGGPGLAWRIYWLLACLLWFSAVVLDFGFYAYLSQRLSALALTLAMDGREAVGTVWANYPVVWIALGLVVFLWLADRLACRLHAVAVCDRGVAADARAGGPVQAGPASPPPARGRRWLNAGRAVVAELALVFVVGLVMMGKWSLYPLRWSDTVSLPSPFAQALALNPLHSVRDTWKVRAGSVTEREARVDSALVRRYVGLPPLRDDQRFDLTRWTPPAADGRPRPKNVVLVLMESFAAHKVGAFGSPMGVTPNFDALARDGLLFTRMMTAQGGTAKGVFSTLTGIPDVSERGNASANPAAVNQHLILNDFRDHEKFYFIGGSTTWANVRGFLTAGIDDLHLYEEGTLESPSTTGPWGVSDHDLLLEAKGILDRAGKPFFAFVQTAGNHRPYIIPSKDAQAMGLETPDARTLAAQGFVSVDEYNAFRYLDWSIGQFMAQARKSPWFEDTVFAFIGDHGIAGGTGPHMPQAFGLHLLTHGHTPFLIYAPKYVAPGVRDHWAQQVDVMPTLASLAGIGYRNTTLGRDLLDPRFDADHVAFGFRYPGAQGIGLLTGHHYLHKIDGTPGLQMRVYDLDAPDPLEDLGFTALRRLGLEERARFMLAYARAASYLLTHNPKLPTP